MKLELMLKRPSDSDKEKTARKERYSADVAKQKAARKELMLMQLKKKTHVKSAMLRKSLLVERGMPLVLTRRRW